MTAHPDGFSFYHFVETTIPTCVTIILFLIVNRRNAKKEQDARHAENQKQIADLVTQSKFLPAHKHGEKSGNLTFGGLSYKPREL